MEEREGTSNSNNISSSFGLKQHVDPPGYHMDPPRSENPFPVGLGNTASENAPLFSLTIPVENSSSELKKKRGRPRKYNPDGSLAMTLSPMPISTEFASRKRGRGRRRGRGRVRGRVEPPINNNNNNNNWVKNPQMLEFENSSPEVASASFTAHVLRVNAGEDVTMKIMTFCQQGSRAICILSANGPISNVTLGQSITSGGTLTYQTGGTRSRAGGMSVSLAGPDGRVFGGGLAGLFIAAGPVQVMVGSFVEESQQQMKKKQRRERFGIPTTTQASNISFAEDPKARYWLNKPVFIQAPPVSAPHEPSTNAVQGYYTNNTANHIRDLFSPLPGEDDEEDLEGEDDEEDVIFRVVLTCSVSIPMWLVVQVHNLSVFIL